MTNNECQMTNRQPLTANGQLANHQPPTANLAFF
jgi:hypothetical protein